jgi:ABC-type branched-subunit amino acid transport system substrate-binding protein
MKKWLSLAAIAVLCLALVIGVACGGGEKKEEGVTEIKFGFGLCFTGLVGAVIGIPARDAWNLTNEEIGVFEVGGKPCRWKLIFEENGFTSAGGVASASKLIFEDDVDIMWQFGSDASIAAYPFCHDAKMILDSSGLAADMLGPDKPYLFQVSATWDFYFIHFFDWLTREHPEVQRVVCAITDDLMGHSVCDPVCRICEYHGLECVNVWIPSGTVEFFPIATKIMTYDPDLIYSGQPAMDELWDLGYEGLFFDHGWEEALYGTPDWDKCIDHVYVVGPHLYGPWPEVAAFRERFEERYGYAAGTWPTYTRQVLLLWTEVLKKAGTADFKNDLDKIIETAETEVFDTPYGLAFFGGKEINGIGHCLITETAINVIAGPSDYQLVELMTAEENRALSLEVYGGK